MQPSLEKLEKPQIDFIAFYFPVYEFNWVTGCQAVGNESFIRAAASDLIEVVWTLGRVEFADLHPIQSKRSCFVEAHSFQSWALDSFFRLRTEDAGLVESDQTEAIGKVEENGVRRRETIGDEIAKPEDY